MVLWVFELERPFREISHPLPSSPLPSSTLVLQLRKQSQEWGNKVPRVTERVRILGHNLLQSKPPHWSPPCYFTNTDTEVQRKWQTQFQCRRGRSSQVSWSKSREIWPPPFSIHLLSWEWWLSKACLLFWLTCLPAAVSSWGRVPAG